MSHENRKELEGVLKHAKGYIVRLLMQTVSNLWQTSRQQQIIQVCVCAGISLLLSLYLGQTAPDKITVSLKGFLFFCVTLFTLCILMNLFTAVLHLDREREIEEKKNSQKSASNKKNELSILTEPTEYDWLIEYAQKQEQNIALSVEIDNVIYSKSDLEGLPYFYIVFALNVFNKSVYPITFDDKIDNKLIFGYEPLKLTPTFDEPPPLIKPLERGTIRINQRFEKDEAESIQRALDTFEAEWIERSQKKSGGHPIPKKFEFKELIFTIKSSKRFKKVKSAAAKILFLEYEVTKKNFNLKTAVVKSIEFTEFEQEVEKYKNKNAEKAKILSDHEWLINEAAIQSGSIDKYVYWRQSLYTGNRIEDRIHYIVFVLSIYNASVLEIVIDNPIGGKILVADRRLVLDKKLYESPRIIYPNTQENILIQQYLTDEETNFINNKVNNYNQLREDVHKDMPEGYQFYSKEWLFGTKLIEPPIVELKGLEMTIKGSAASSQIKPALLTTINDVRATIENFTKYG